MLIDNKNVISICKSNVYKGVDSKGYDIVYLAPI